MTEKPRFELSDLQYPNLVYRNQKGEVVFQMKRKSKYDLYYIFQVFEDRMDDETLKKWREVFPLLKTIANMMDLPLFDHNEISARISEKMNETADNYGKMTDTERENFQKNFPRKQDVKISLKNHATGDLGTLTVGVTFQKITGEENEDQ